MGGLLGKFCLSLNSIPPLAAHLWRVQNYWAFEACSRETNSRGTMYMEIFRVCDLTGIRGPLFGIQEPHSYWENINLHTHVRILRLR